MIIEGKRKGLEALIDWVQVTFKETKCNIIMKDILQMDERLLTFEGKGRFRYAGKWAFGGIELLTPPLDYMEMGHHIYLTGSACRAFEIYLRAQGRTWFDFFETCLNYGGSFTRLDIAIDDRKTYFELRTMINKIRRKECVSKFKNRVLLDSGTTSGEDSGRTINLGSRESLCSMCFYEKNYEQSKRTGLPIEFYGKWNRYEIRLRKEVATNCIREIVENQDICFIGLEILNYYLRMVVKNKHDENRNRWKTWKPWGDFIEGVGRLKLTMQPAPRTLEQKKKWIETYVAPTLKMIKTTDEKLEEDFLMNTIDGAILKESQKKTMQDYLNARYELRERWKEEESSLKELVEVKKNGFHNAINIPFK